MKFTGQLFDAETGLAYFNARYLWASMGAYISADEPLNDQGTDDPQSWKLDSYVRNNPLAYSDPSGMSCQGSSGPCYSTPSNPGWTNWAQWAAQNFQYYRQNAVNQAVNLVQLTAPVVRYLSAPRDQNCVKAWAAAGSVIGAAAVAEVAAPIGAAGGAVGGTFALPVGGTIAGGVGGYVVAGAAGGVVGGAGGALGGGAVGWLMCSTSVTPPGGGGEPAHKYAGKKVRDILQGKKGSIKGAALDPGSPEWNDILDKSWEEIEQAAKSNKTGYKTIKKLLTDGRFDKSK